MRHNTTQPRIRLADAIAKLDQRVEHFMVEGRNATQALGVKVEFGRPRIVGARDANACAPVPATGRPASIRPSTKLRNGNANWSEKVLHPRRQPRANGAPCAAMTLPTIHDQLRQVSEQVETFGASRMNEAIDALRNDLADIAGKLTEASPRRAIEALESEVRELASQLDVGRRSGGHELDLSSIESGLAEVRDAIRALTPAESLSGAVDAIHVLSQKIDQMAAGAQDPAAIQQLEAAITGLRGIVSRVASDDSLAALTAEVRALSEKINSGLSGVASGSNILQTLEQRIGTIADAIEIVRISAASPGSSALEAAIRSLGEKIERMQAASDQHAGGADLGAMIGSLGDRIERMHAASDPLAGNSPFGTMIGSLSEKIERLQAARGDSDVLRQIEQRIAALSEKLEASEAKLGNLDSIDRGMKELLTYLESIRSGSTHGCSRRRARFKTSSTMSLQNAGIAGSRSWHHRRCGRSPGDDRNRHARHAHRHRIAPAQPSISAVVASAAEISRNFRPDSLSPRHPSCRHPQRRVRRWRRKRRRRQRSPLLQTRHRRLTTSCRTIIRSNPVPANRVRAWPRCRDASPPAAPASPAERIAASKAVVEPARSVRHGILTPS